MCLYAVPYWFLFEHAVKAVAKQGLPRRTFTDAIKEGDKRTALMSCYTKVKNGKEKLTSEVQREKFTNFQGK